MEASVIKELRFLKVYVLFSTIVFIAVICFSFSRRDPGYFEELNVERINVREKNGQLRMVISNRERQHPGRMGGKESAPRIREAGMIFFNGDGDECGGLIFDNDKQEAGFAISVDKYRNDQVLQLNYNEELTTGRSSYGMQLWSRDNKFDYPGMIRSLDSIQVTGDRQAYESAIEKYRAAGALGQPLMFVGKNGSSGAGVFIRDQQGRARLRMYVDSTGEGRVEWLDASGRVTKRQ